MARMKSRGFGRCGGCLSDEAKYREVVGSAASYSECEYATPFQGGK
jgi:hypothetical protein